MGVRVLESRDGKMAALYCSTSDWAFGPVFYSTDEADAKDRALAFLNWLPVDARTLTDSQMERKYYDWCSSLRPQFPGED